MTKNKWTTSRGSKITIEDGVLIIKGDKGRSPGTHVNLSDKLSINLTVTKESEIYVGICNESKRYFTHKHAGRYSSIDEAISLARAILAAGQHNAH